MQLHVGDVKVFCRVRPLSEEEKTKRTEFQFRDSSTGGAHVLAGCTLYTLNERVFDAEASQEDVFARAAKPIVDHALETEHIGTIVAYGDKTQTIVGGSDRQQEGIFARAIRHIFDKRCEGHQLNARKQKSVGAAQSAAFSVVVDHFEVVGNTLRDLLAPPADEQQRRPPPIEVDELQQKIRPTSNGGAGFVRGLQGREFHSAEDVLAAVANVEESSNASRSHRVFLIRLRRNDQSAGPAGILLLVDLAPRLSALDQIVESSTALYHPVPPLLPSDQQETQFVWLLQKALASDYSGQSLHRTAIVVCCTPTQDAEPAIRASLLFAERAQQMRTIKLHSTNRKRPRQQEEVIAEFGAEFGTMDEFVEEEECAETGGEQHSAASAAAPVGVGIEQQAAGQQQQEAEHLLQRDLSIGAKKQITARDRQTYSATWNNDEHCRRYQLDKKWTICRPLQDGLPHKEHVFFHNAADSSFVWDRIPAELEQRADVRMLYQDANLMRYRDRLLAEILRSIRGDSIDAIVKKELSQGDVGKALRKLERHFNTPGLPLLEKDEIQRTDRCNYQLLDPRYLRNMDTPDTATFLEFCNAVFYVGEGDPTIRPFSHAREALQDSKISAKTCRITEIWSVDETRGPLVNISGCALAKNMVRILEACTIQARYTYDWGTYKEVKTEYESLREGDGGIELCNISRENWKLPDTLAKRWTPKGAEAIGVLTLMRAYLAFTATPSRPIMKSDAVLRDDDWSAAYSESGRGPSSDFKSPQWRGGGERGSGTPDSSGGFSTPKGRGNRGGGLRRMDSSDSDASPSSATRGWHITDY